jgi:molecular chaperone DnaJ
MPQAPDLYGLLGVSREVSPDEMRKAYLKLAHKYHPDKTGGDKDAEDKLKQINAAYDILKNPEKRAKFDRFGSTDAQSGGGGGFGADMEAPVEDFFDMLFGQGGGRRRASRGTPGNDLELGISVSLNEAAVGVKKTLRFSRLENCAECSGAGAAPGSTAEACAQCGGGGQVRVAQGFFSVTRTCPKCRGAGKVISKPCRKCNGVGQAKASRELAVDIPAGVDTGTRMRVTGEGEAGRGNGPRGDLYVHIEVEDHDLFERDGVTLVCEYPISFAEASLGGTVRVPTLDGEVELKIPAGTQTGAQFRLRGLGMPDLRGYRKGDQIVRAIVETPAKLNRRQKELLKELEELSDHRMHPLKRRFNDAVTKLKK